MSRLLALKKNPIQSYTFEGLPVYRAQGASELKEYDFYPVNKGGTTSSLPSFSTDVTIQFTASQDVGLVQDVIMNCKITNAGARTCIFKNVYSMFKSLRLRLNNEEIDYLSSTDLIYARQNVYWRWNQEQMYTLQQHSLNQTSGSTLSGLTIAASTDTYVSISLLPLFPYLEGIHTKYFDKLQLDFAFQDNDGTAGGVGLFCASSDTTNAYTTDLTIDLLKFTTIVNLAKDPRLASFDSTNYNPPIHKFQAKTYTASWTTANTDTVVVNMRNDFTEIRSCQGVFVYVQSPSMMTVFNDADAQIKYTTPEYIGITVRSDTTVQVDHSHATNHLVNRRRYARQNQLNSFSADFKPEVFASDNSNKYYVCIAYIPFTNIPLASEHEVLLNGVNTKHTNIEITLTCGTSLHASSIIHVIPHYLESFKVDQKTRVCTVNKDVLNVA